MPKPSQNAGMLHFSWFSSPFLCLSRISEIRYVEYIWVFIFIFCLQRVSESMCLFLIYIYIYTHIYVYIYRYTYLYTFTYQDIYVFSSPFCACWGFEAPNKLYTYIYIYICIYSLYIIFPLPVALAEMPQDVKGQGEAATSKQEVGPGCAIHLWWFNGIYICVYI